MNESASDFWARFQEAVQCARKPEYQSAWFLVVACGFAYGLGILALVIQRTQFAFSGTADIIGWVSVHQYPKQQEFFYYLLALVLVPSVTVLCWSIWLALTVSLSRFAAGSFESFLNQTAFTFPPLFLVLGDAYSREVSLPELCGWMGCVAALNFILLLCQRLRRFLPFPAHRGIVSLPAVSQPHMQQEALPSGGGVEMLIHTSKMIASLLEFMKTTTSWVEDKISSAAKKTVLPEYKLSGRSVIYYCVVPALLYAALFSLDPLYYDIDLFHEGEFLAPLNEMLRGKIPYRDFYIQHGLFANAYFPLLASKLLGPTLEGWRLFQCLLRPLGYVCLYFLGTQIFKSPVTAILAIFVVYIPDLQRTDRFSFGLISVALVANHIGNRQSWDFGFLTGENRWIHKARAGLRFGWRLVMAGWATVLAFCHSTEIGLYAFAAIVLFLIISEVVEGVDSGRDFRATFLPLGCYSVGVSMSLLPILIYFSWHHGLGSFIDNIYKQCAYQTAVWGLPFPPLSADRPWGNGSVHEFLTSETIRSYLPIFLFLVGGTFLLHQTLRGRNSLSNRKFMLLWLWGVVCFRTALGRTDGPHVLRSGMMGWLVYIFFLELIFFSVVDKLARFGRGHNAFPAFKFICQFTFILFSLGYIASARGGSTEFPYMNDRDEPVLILNPKEYEGFSPTRVSPLSRVGDDLAARIGRVPTIFYQAAHIQEVVDYIQNNASENETIFDFSNQGAYYFFANRPSATRYFQIIHAASGSMQKEVIRDLEARKPRVVIYQTGGRYDRIDRVSMATRLPLINQFLERHYEAAANINGTILLRPK